MSGYNQRPPNPDSLGSPEYLPSLGTSENSAHMLTVFFDKVDRLIVAAYQSERDVVDADVLAQLCEDYGNYRRYPQ